jgi:hypothetical protein
LYFAGGNAYAVVYWQRNSDGADDSLIHTAFLCISGLVVDRAGPSAVFWWWSLSGFTIVRGSHVEVSPAVSEARHSPAMILRR